MHQHTHSSSDDTSKVRIFLSTDTIMECFTNFKGYGDAVEELIRLAKFKGIKAFISDYCLQKVGFFLGKPDSELGHEAVSRIRTLLEDRVIYINRGLIEDARRLPIEHFDTAIEVACAMACNLHAIVTPKPDYFAGTTLPVIGIEDFLKRQVLEDSLQIPTSLTVLTTNWQFLQKLDEQLSSSSQFQMNLYGINARNNLAIINLRFADLKKVNLSSAILRGADLRGADMQEAKLMLASLYYARLSGANLSYADLRGVNLGQASLNDVNLSFADLSNSNLSACDLSNAVLYEANLKGTNLQGADLQNATLQGADLQGANLQGTRLQDANVNLAKFGQNVGIPEYLKVELLHRGAIFLEGQYGKRTMSVRRWNS